MNNNIAGKDKLSQPDSILELLGQLAKNSAAVVHDEIALVIQGVREKVRALRQGVLIIIAGGVLSFAALLCLCAAIIIGLSAYMPPVLSAFITGVTMAMIGFVTIFVGYKHAQKASLGKESDAVNIEKEHKE